MENQTLAPDLEYEMLKENGRMDLENIIVSFPSLLAERHRRRDSESSLVAEVTLKSLRADDKLARPY